MSDYDHMMDVPEVMQAVANYFEACRLSYPEDDPIGMVESDALEVLRIALDPHLERWVKDKEGLTLSGRRIITRKRIPGYINYEKLGVTK